MLGGLAKWAVYAGVMGFGTLVSGLTESNEHPSECRLQTRASLAIGHCAGAIK